MKFKNSLIIILTISIAIGIILPLSQVCRAEDQVLNTEEAPSYNVAPNFEQQGRESANQVEKFIKNIPKWWSKKVTKPTQNWWEEEKELIVKEFKKEKQEMKEDFYDSLKKYLQSLWEDLKEKLGSLF